ncbi:MAG: DUF456 family protein [Planctomycetaceae bacterium]
MYYVWYTLLVLLCASSLLATLMALPGNWGIVLLGGLFAWLVPDSRLSVLAVGVAAALATVGEIVELAAGAAGAAKLGAKRSSMILSMVLTIVGSIVGSFLVPIPVIGTVIGALGGGAIGAYAGAYAGEVHAGTDKRLGHKIGGAAMKGRILGTLAKLTIGAAIFGVIVIDAWS